MGCIVSDTNLLARGAPGRRSRYHQLCISSKVDEDTDLLKQTGRLHTYYWKLTMVVGSHNISHPLRDQGVEKKKSTSFIFTYIELVEQSLTCLLLRYMPINFAQ